MSNKYYKCIKDNFMWVKGAILESNGNGYRPISDLWNKVDLRTEYISDHIIENPENKDFFERVYEITHDKRRVFLPKKEAQKMFDAFYEGEKK